MRRFNGRSERIATVIYRCWLDTKKGVNTGRMNDSKDKMCMIQVIRKCEQYMIEIGVSHEYAIMKDIREVLKMDKVITCICGCQSWIIGYSGTRCCQCGKFLESGSVTADIDEINNILDTARHEAERKSEELANNGI